MLGRFLSKMIACATLAIACGRAEPQVKHGSDAADRDAAVVQPATCVRAEPDLNVFTDIDQAVPAGTSITYTLEIASHDQGDCEPEVYLVSTATPREIKTFSSEPVAIDSPPIAAGERARLEFVVASGSDEEPGAYQIDFFA